MPSAARLGRRLYEVPVGFKWFVDGLHDGSLGFGGEESAGASFLRRDGSVWTTDKDGITAALLSAEITAPHRPRPGRAVSLAHRCARRAVRRSRRRRPATREQAKRLSSIEPSSITAGELAGERVESVVAKASGNGAAIGGIKVTTAKRLVRRKTVRHRAALQDLRGELQESGAPEPAARRSAADRRRRARAGCVVTRPARVRSAS